MKVKQGVRPTGNKSKSTSKRERKKDANTTPLQENHIVCECRNSDKMTKNADLILTSPELDSYFALLEDSTIKYFLTSDTCMLYADKYLLAMVVVYFKRARYSVQNYTRFNFFVALYLAHILEEDDQDLKVYMLQWLLGRNWKDHMSLFLTELNSLLKTINYKCVISRKCCEEVMSITPDHPVWQRTRSDFHAGAIRSYDIRRSLEDVWDTDTLQSPCYHCTSQLQSTKNVMYLK